MQQLSREVFVGLGSNLGDRLSHLQRAIDEIGQLGATTVRRCSGFYETEPRFVRDQPVFLNACVNIETGLPPRKLLGALLGIEDAMGRVRRQPNGPRIIDLDLLLYGACVIDDDDLHLPHPGLHSRAFVLVPLAEVGAQTHHPLLDQTILELRERCPDTGWVRTFELGEAAGA